MPDLENAYVDDEMTKSDIKDFVKDARAEAEPLQDVTLSQNKDDLIEAVNDALDRHLDDLAQADGQEVQEFGEDDLNEEEDDTSSRGQAGSLPYAPDVSDFG